MKTIKDTILLADTNKVSLAMGKNLLDAFYEVFTAATVTQIYEALECGEIDLIIISSDLPEASASEVTSSLKTDPRYERIPVIINLTSGGEYKSVQEHIDLGLADYAINKAAARLLMKHIDKELQIAKKEIELLDAKAQLTDIMENLNNKVNEKTKEVQDLQSIMLTAVADLIEFRDSLTGGHVMRTRLYLEALVKQMVADGVYEAEISGWNMKFFLDSAQLHDVGKIAVSDPILNKRGMLTIEEKEIIQDHVLAGVRVIKRIMEYTDERNYLLHALNIISFHHEKWDGTGYPFGLMGDSIPLEGRLMAIADVYDALISVRPYKKAFTHEEACRIIEESAGTHFDPALVDVFRSVKNEFARITQ